VIQILGGIIATAVTLTAFAYTNFQTKTETQETIRQLEKHQQLILNTIEKRLERIENKLDQK
jgi:hypothetical protein